MSGSGFVEDAVIQTEEAPRNTFLRERFRARCIERAQKDREKKIRGKRHMQEPSSDGVDEDMDQDDEDEGALMDDELFRRIITSTNRKQQHSYRLSYSQDVGSSFDPNLEDINQWEADLGASVDIPDDLDEEELQTYAAEYELHLEDIDPDQLFGVSDSSDSEDQDGPSGDKDTLVLMEAHQGPESAGGDVEMAT